MESVSAPPHPSGPEADRARRHTGTRAAWRAFPLGTGCPCLPVFANVPRRSGGGRADNRSMRIHAYVRPIVVALAALVFPACSDSKDALVVNPCRTQIEVRFGSYETVDDRLGNKGLQPGFRR